MAVKENEVILKEGESYKLWLWAILNCGD